MARRLVRIPVLPNVTVSKAETFWANGGGAANAGPNARKLSVRELRSFELTQAPAIPAEPASKNSLRSMPSLRFPTLLYFINLLEAVGKQVVITTARVARAPSPACRWPNC